MNPKPDHDVIPIYFIACFPGLVPPIERGYIAHRFIAVHAMGGCMSLVLPSKYRPSEKEKFMNPKQKEYFKLRLLEWKEELLGETRDTLDSLQVENLVEPDMADRATLETGRSLELRTRDRQRKLVGKIDAALRRIEDGTYGYCEETNAPISLRRLEARPIATLTIEAQEQHERMERSHRDD